MLAVGSGQFGRWLMRWAGSGAYVLPFSIDEPDGGWSLFMVSGGIS